MNFIMLILCVVQKGQNASNPPQDSQFPQVDKPVHLSSQNPGYLEPAEVDPLRENDQQQKLPYVYNVLLCNCVYRYDMRI